MCVGMCEGKGDMGDVKMWVYRPMLDGGGLGNGTANMYRREFTWIGRDRIGKEEE